MAWNYDKRHIDELIMQYVPARAGLQKTVCDAMADAVEAGGKRVRPILIYETYRFFAGEAARDEIPAPFMAAMEMIHTFSLIHDDLPCMDNDVLRRGQPTTWVTYGEDMATLAGDALALEAFAVCAAAAERMEDCRTGIRAARILAEKSSIGGMIGGQTVDVEKTGQPLTQEELDFIYRLKTGALLEASMMMGAVLGGASEEELRTVERIAANVGMAFQIQDDILDETASQEDLGKPLHSDQENGKTTFVTLYGLKEAREAVLRCSKEAETLLTELAEGRAAEGRPADASRIGELIAALTVRDR